MRPGFSRLFILLLGLMTSVGPAKADPTASFNLNRISDVHAGIFCYRAPDYLTRDTETIDGTVDRFDTAPDLVKQTQVIPALDGLLFGVSGRGAPGGDLVVTMEVVHPPLGEKGITRETWEAWYPNDRITMNGYTLGLDRGSPIGTWTVSAKRNGKMVFEVQFEVVKAKKSDRHLLDGCKT